MNVPLSILLRRHALIVFFLLAFGIAWGFWIPAALATKGLLPFPIPETLAGLLGVWGPSLAGIFVTAAHDGRAGLGTLFRRLSIWRVELRWYLFVLLWPAILSLLVTGFSLLFGSPAPDFAHPPVMNEYPVPPEAFSAGFLPLLPMVFVIQVFGSSLGEELGWRGFALPRLQTRRSTLLASIVLGVLWGLWHLPRVWTPGEPFDAAAFGWLMLGFVLNSVLYAWVFNGTKGSLLLVVLFHTAQPVTNLFLAKVPNPLVESAITVALVGLVAFATGVVGERSTARREAAS